MEINLIIGIFLVVLSQRERYYIYIYIYTPFLYDTLQNKKQIIQEIP